jgi:hypothetical protein
VYCCSPNSAVTLLGYLITTIATEAITHANPTIMQVSEGRMSPSDEWVLEEWDLELSNEDDAHLQEIKEKSHQLCLTGR